MPDLTERVTTEYWLAYKIAVPTIYTKYIAHQARMHTGFHRFTEIGQNFPIHYKTDIDIDEIICVLQGFIQGEWNYQILCQNDSKIQERGLKEVRIKKFSGEACPDPRFVVNRLTLFLDGRLHACLHPHNCTSAHTSQLIT